MTLKQFPNFALAVRIFALTQVSSALTKIVQNCSTNQLKETVEMRLQLQVNKNIPAFATT